MKYQAVLFDLMGTLVPSATRKGYRLMVDRIAVILGQSKDEFFEQWMAVNNDRLLGTLGSSEGDIRHVATLFGVEVTDDQMAACMSSRRAATMEWLTPKPRTIETLTRLTELNCKLALVSDCVFDIPAVWGKTPMSELIPTTVFSCVEGLRKPDTRMYQRALTGLGVSPEVALFVGDGGSDELKGAVNAGIYAVHLDDQPSVSEVLRVDVREWNGPSVTDISEVVALVSQGSPGV